MLLLVVDFRQLHIPIAAAERATLPTANECVIYIFWKSSVVVVQVTAVEDFFSFFFFQ